ncbi:hypothetical protein OH76DRAFT_197521 [Lentinus brumalis]|uniref:Uncharacterized protein n=1 Tax=Lentinus brumalis TaxID=2498619 RepID=A0A371DI38_9APHY|nr:hypothetical protein OH76DRAFT_197521 [Polyporus brumalis]
MSITQLKCGDLCQTPLAVCARPCGAGWLVKRCIQKSAMFSPLLQYLLELECPEQPQRSDRRDLQLDVDLEDLSSSAFVQNGMAAR